MSLVLLIAAILCILYYGVLAVYIGVTSMTALTWLFLGAAGGVCSFLWKILKKKGILAAAPLWLKVAGATTAAVVLLLFVFVEAFIIRGMYETPEEGADYLIVLGAKVQGKTVSQSLKNRLDAAIAYLERNPQTTVIVSGGQGPDEEMTEAQAMYEYLTERGISPYRIIREGWSANTRQNLVYSMAYVNRGEKVVIVTNGFHMFRATAMAGKVGEAQISGLPAKNDPILLPHSLVREFFSVIKAKWLGHL